jgi:DNA-binding GntR family transcriptional regulator
LREIRATAAERVAGLLRQRLLCGDFPAGNPLREEELAAEYGVSRHLIREVLRTLASEGMAEYSAFKGVRVPRLTRGDVADIYQARRFLECGVVFRKGLRGAGAARGEIKVAIAPAVEQASWSDAFDLDVRFHSSLVAAGDSPRLTAWHGELMMALRLAHLVAPDFQGPGLIRSVPQHAEVIVALARADLPRAAAALEHHLEDAERLLIEGIDASTPRPRAVAARAQGAA